MSQVRSAVCMHFANLSVSLEFDSLYYSAATKVPCCELHEVPSARPGEKTVFSTVVDP